MGRERLSAEVRQRVAERARHCCEYCRSQERFAMQPFSVEHIEPRSKAGTNLEENLAFACQGCNNHKYTKTHHPDPATSVPASLFHPRRDRWRDHFRWNDDYSLLVGLTPTGRATVDALRLNRPGLVNLRQLLYAAGAHPPSGPETTESKVVLP